MSSFRLLVTDLIGRPGAHRSETFTAELGLAMDLARIDSPVEVAVRMDATSREIIAAGTVDYRLEATCHRCLTSIDRAGRARFSQVYRYDGPDDDEDVLMVSNDGHIDLEQPVVDEVGLSLPLAPVCRDDCAGLCPTCGNDLNTDPCDGHEEESSSPFAVLEHFLDPQE